MDDTTFPLSAAPSADDSLNFYLIDATMSFFPQTEKVHSFFVYAISVTNK
jgi:hypothetical protein